MVSAANEATGPRLSPPVGASAIVLSGFYEGLEVALDRERIVIGRGRKADLALAEATISRAHAAVGFDADGFFIEDLDSTNGTRVNGAPVDAPNEFFRLSSFETGQKAYCLLFEELSRLESGAFG